MEIIEMIQKNDMLKLALILVAVYFFMQYYNKETLDNVVSDKIVDLPVVAAPAPVDTTEQQQIDKIVAGTSTLTTADLLPKYDDASDFAKQNPVSKVLQSQNFLQAGYHVGINTVIQSNKIPYNDIRSMPPIPKNNNVSPWMNSSYEESPGSKRKFFEIGS